ncbi:MAG: hypothetical protein IJU98_08060 [Synergistaceae bacterium]|nr:hypothetical protein [Synergistaceae bacterium]
MFFLAKGLRWGYREVMEMPRGERLWYVARLRKQYKIEEEELKKARHGK